MSLNAVTRGSQWSRPPWGSIPTPWTPTLSEWTYLNASWTMRAACTVTDSSAQSGASLVSCERWVASNLHAHVQECFSADAVINVFADTGNQPDPHVRERTLYSEPRWKEDGAVFNKCKLTRHRSGGEHNIFSATAAKCSSNNQRNNITHHNTHSSRNSGLI